MREFEFARTLTESAGFFEGVNLGAPGAQCAELGVPVDVARECLDFQLVYALTDAAYARRNGLPCLGDAESEAAPDATGASGETGYADKGGFGAGVDAVGFDFTT